MSDAKPDLQRWAKVARDACRAFAALWILGAAVAAIAVFVFNADIDATIWKILPTTFVIGMILAGALWLVGEARRGYRSEN